MKQKSYQRTDKPRPAPNNRTGFMNRIKGFFSKGTDFEGRKAEAGKTVHELENAWNKHGGFNRRDLEFFEREYDDLLVERDFDDLD